MKKMAFAKRLLAVAGLGLILSACSDPQVTKVRHLEKGDALMTEGKLADAVIEYRNAIKIDARYGEARFQLAQAYEKTGNQQAGREYLRAAELLPGRLDVQLKAASILLSAKEFERARKHADLAITADAKSVDAQILRAYALAGLKDVEGASQELYKAMESAPGDYRPHASLGAVEAMSGNTAEAEAAFKKAVEIDPTSVAAKLAQAYFYWNTRKGPEAERTLKEVLSAEPTNLAANRLLALYYLSSGRAKEAEAPLVHLSNAQDAQSTLALADLYLGTKRRDQARPLYELLKIDKATREVAVGRLASIDYAEGRRPEAHAALDTQLQETPKSVGLLTLKAQWLTSEGQREPAVAAARQAVAADAQSASAHFVLGVAEAANRNFDAAISAHKEVLRLSPNMTAAQVELSRLLMATGENDQALQLAQSAKKAAPGNPQVRLNAARALLGKGDIRGAEAEVKTLMKQFPDASPVHALQGRVLLARADAAGAEREFDRALALNPAEVEAVAGSVTLDMRQKRPQDARATLERAIAKAPASSSLLLIAAQVERTDGNPAGAEKHLRRAIEIDPSNLQAYNALGGLYVSQNRLDEAKRELEEIVRRKADSVPARTMIAMIQQIQGRDDDAIKTYDGIVREASTAAVASNNLAYLYADRGEQLDRAVELAQNAKQQLPENPDVSDTLGWAYYKRGMPELAVKQLEFSVQKDPQNALYLVHLGLAYAKAGMTDKAKASLTQALKLKADVAGASEARAVLASLSPQG